MVRQSGVPLGVRNSERVKNSKPVMLSAAKARPKTVVCLNSHNEKGELAHRPEIFALTGHEQEG
jgi:hypothetical protein